MARPFPHVEGVEHRYVDAAGLNMHVAEAGPPDGDPIVLLHGWPQHWYQWRHQIPKLAERHRVIVPDLRGLGWTEAPPDGYDKENMGTDVLNLLDALGLDKVRLVGHDWGGWIGFLIAFRAPERFERYVALNIPTPWANRDPRNFLDIWRFWYMAVLASPWLGRHVVQNTNFVRRIIQGTNKRPDVWTDEQLAEYTDVLREPDRARASVMIYRTFLLKEFLRVGAGQYNSQRLTVPTRLVFGMNDFAISKRFLDQDFSRHADHFEVERVPDTGHFIGEEQPELVTDRILDFFSAADRPAAVG
jgi:pimeloyl-ACP methyl ester carboxylesterase